MQKEPKTINQRKNAERKWPIEAASIRDALVIRQMRQKMERVSVSIFLTQMNR